MALAAARNAGGQAMARPTGVAPLARRVMSIMQLSKSLLPKIRGAANGKVETSRGRKSPALECM